MKLWSKVRNILTALCLKFKAYTHEKIAITPYFILFYIFLNMIWSWDIIAETLWWLNLIKDLINLVTGFFRKPCSVLQIVHYHFTKFARLKLQLIACVEVVISSKSWAPKSISRESHMKPFITSSIDSVYQSVSSI